MAYRLTEWIFEGYYRFVAGDYALLDQAEAQCEMLNVWKDDNVDTVMIQFKQNYNDAVKKAEHDHSCDCDECKHKNEK